MTHACQPVTFGDIGALVCKATMTAAQTTCTKVHAAVYSEINAKVNVQVND